MGCCQSSLPDVQRGGASEAFPEAAHVNVTLPQPAESCTTDETEVVLQLWMADLPSVLDDDESEARRREIMEEDDLEMTLPPSQIPMPVVSGYSLHDDQVEHNVEQDQHDDDYDDDDDEGISQEEIERDMEGKEKLASRQSLSGLQQELENEFSQMREEYLLMGVPENRHHEQNDRQERQVNGNVPVHAHQANSESTSGTQEHPVNDSRDQQQQQHHQQLRVELQLKQGQQPQLRESQIRVGQGEEAGTDQGGPHGNQAEQVGEQNEVHVYSGNILSEFKSETEKAEKDLNTLSEKLFPDRTLLNRLLKGNDVYKEMLISIWSYRVVGGVVRARMIESVDDRLLHKRGVGDLRRICSELWELDVTERRKYPDVKVRQTESRFDFNLPRELLRSPIVSRFVSLLERYQDDMDDMDIDDWQDLKKLEQEFIRKMIRTPPMKKSVHYARKKELYTVIRNILSGEKVTSDSTTETESVDSEGVEDEDDLSERPRVRFSEETISEEEVVRLMWRIWFERDGYHASPFHHVFVGFCQNGGRRRAASKGMHNWIQFQRLLDADRITLPSTRPIQINDTIVSLRVKLDGCSEKPNNTMFLRTLPDFEFSLHTLLYLVALNLPSDDRHGNRATTFDLELGGNNVCMVCVTSGNRMVTSYPRTCFS